MADLVEALHSSMQRNGEMWHTSIDLIDGDPNRHIVKIEPGEQYLSTANVTPNDLLSGQLRREKPAADEEVYTHQFALATRISESRLDNVASILGIKRTTTATRQPLFLIMDNNYVNPVLRIDPGVEDIMSLSDLESVSDTNRYLPTILKCIDASISTQWMKHQERLRNRGLNTLKIGGTALALTLGLVGVDKGFRGVQHAFHTAGVHRAEGRARETAEREVFDSQNVTFSTASRERGGTFYVEPLPAFFDRNIPKPTKHDTFEHPRQVTIDQKCVPVTSLPAGESVKIITDGQTEEIIASVSSSGDVELCEPDFSVVFGLRHAAVQIVAKQPR